MSGYPSPGFTQAARLEKEKIALKSSGRHQETETRYQEIQALSGEIIGLLDEVEQAATQHDGLAA